MNDRSDHEGEAPAPEPTIAPAPVSGTDRAGDRTGDRPGREPGELVVALSPRQIIGGFALLAALILMLKRRGQGKG
jgi:hypothetical protein